jgi:hypothetical protein
LVRAGKLKQKIAHDVKAAASGVVGPPPVNQSGAVFPEVPSWPGKNHRFRKWIRYTTSHFPFQVSMVDVLGQGK